MVLARCLELSERKPAQSNMNHMYVVNSFKVSSGTFLYICYMPCIQLILHSNNNMIFQFTKWMSLFFFFSLHFWAN